MIARLLISPSIERRVDEIKKILASHITRGLIAQGSGNTNHPDLLYIKAGEKLGIAQARKIKEHFSLKPYSAKGAVVVLEDASVMTDEAQNALLKTLEEPPKEAILILGANSDTNFLPTILSRCKIITLETRSDDRLVYHSRFIPDLEKLLSYSIEERFAFIEKLKNKEEFLKALILYFHQDVTKNKDFLMKLLQTEAWAKQNVNIRAILEYLMLVMPKKSQESSD
ncbi:hypothetical protein HYU45_04110 [Candidatus Daviesbacteria bacterium]|nr:hypothetical protein [Candidatus Daviesbacteria bacterium]